MHGFTYLMVINFIFTPFFIFQCDVFPCLSSSWHGSVIHFAWELLVLSWCWSLFCMSFLVHMFNVPAWEECATFHVVCMLYVDDFWYGLTFNVVSCTTIIIGLIYNYESNHVVIMLKVWSQSVGWLYYMSRTILAHHLKQAHNNTYLMEITLNLQIWLWVVA